MSRPVSGSHSDLSIALIDAGQRPYSLAEAKLAAWEIAVGERPAQDHSSSRRLHRGMASDLPMPEPPSAREPWLKPLLARMWQALASVAARPAPAAAAIALSAEAPAAMAADAPAAYMEQTVGAESPAVVAALPRAA